MTLETGPGLGGRPPADVREAREILKTLRQGRPLRRGPNGHILDSWEALRVAGLVREGTTYSDTKIIIVTTPTGEQVETPVRGTVVINSGRDTLFVPADSKVMTQIFPRPSGRV